MNGESWITRSHCEFLPGPFLFNAVIDERIPFTALTPKSRFHAERIAATLEGGDRRLSGKSYAHYDEGTPSYYGKATLITPLPYYTLYAHDQIWKRGDGEVVILRRSLVVPPPPGINYLRFSLPKTVSLDWLTAECRERVLQLAAKLKTHDSQIWVESCCAFKWDDNPVRLLDPSNYRVTLRDTDETAT